MKKSVKKCNHIKENYEAYLVNPLDSGIRNFSKLVQYFQYDAPQIDSIHSVGVIESNKKQNDILQKMLKSAGMQNKSNFIQRIQPNSMELFQLDSRYICIRCPRMVCKRGKDETELSSLLRHIRNTFAHGRTYIKKTRNQTYIVLEDYDKSKKPKLTAKIVFTKSILEKWKGILEEECE